jgi:prepilin-type processing-associated H-X9-DG protein
MKTALANVVVMVALLMVPGTAPGNDAASEVAPLVDRHTLVVVRMDLARLEVAELGDWLVQRMQAAEGVEPAAREQAAAGFREDAIHPLATWAQELRDAGAERIYWLVYTSHVDEAMPLVLAVPVTDATAPRVEALLTRNIAAREHVQRKGELLLAGWARRLELVEEIQPVQRPELAAGFAEAGDAPVRVVMMPAEGFQEQIAGEMRGAPPAVQALVDALFEARWAAASLAPPPGPPSAQITVQATDAQGAEALSAQLKQVLQLMQEIPELQKTTPQLVQWLNRVEPKVQEEQVVVQLQERMLGELVSAAVPGVILARQQAMIVQSMSQMRQILVALLMYTHDNDGQLPDSLDDLKRYLGEQGERLLKDPRRPEGKNHYVYVKPAETIDQVARPGEQVILYEPYEPWSGGVNVGFADGHIEYWADEQRAREALAPLKQKAQQP